MCCRKHIWKKKRLLMCCRKTHMKDKMTGSHLRSSRDKADCQLAQKEIAHHRFLLEAFWNAYTAWKRKQKGSPNGRSEYNEMPVAEWQRMNSAVIQRLEGALSKALSAVLHHQLHTKNCLSSYTNVYRLLSRENLMKCVKGQKKHKKKGIR